VGAVWKNAMSYWAWRPSASVTDGDLLQAIYRRTVSRIDPARLDDLADVLAEIRAWDDVEDRGGGTFYLHHRPFLHFHAGRDSRRADVRRANGWVQIDLPEPARGEDRRRLLAVLKAERADR
jgi:hypothetical protein